MFFCVLFFLSSRTTACTTMTELQKLKRSGWWTLEKVLSNIKTVRDEDDEDTYNTSISAEDSQSKECKLIKVRARFTCKGKKLDIKGCFHVFSAAFEYQFNGLYSNNTSTKGYCIFNTEKLEYRPKKLTVELLRCMISQSEADTVVAWLQNEIPDRDRLLKKWNAGCKSESKDEMTLTNALKSLLTGQQGLRYFWFDELQQLQNYYGVKGREFVAHNCNPNEISWLHNIFLTGHKLELLCFNSTKRKLKKKLTKLPELNYSTFKSIGKCNDTVIENAVSIYHEILRIDVYGHKKSDLFNREKSRQLLYKPANSGHMYSEYGSIIKHCRYKGCCEESLSWLEEHGAIYEVPLRPEDFKYMNTRRHIYIDQMWFIQQRLISQITSVVQRWKNEGGEAGMTRRTGDYGKRSKRKLNKEQEAAVKIAIENPISVITGRGGTGKTEAVKDIVDRYGNDNPRMNTVLFLGPTGRSAVNATQRVQQSYTLDKCAYTLLKAIQMERKDPVMLNDILSMADQIEYDDEDAEANNPLWYLDMTPKEHRARVESQRKAEFAKLITRWKRVEVLIIDEMSMVDIAKFEFLMRVLTHFSPLKKIVIVGDVRQLQSIGAGRIMADIMDAFPQCVTELKTNMRNPSSTIFHNADLCSSRSSSRLRYDQNFRLVKTLSKTNIEDYVTSLMKSLLKDSSVDKYDIHFIAFKRSDAAAINKACRPFYTEHYQPRDDGKADLPEYFKGEKIYFKKNNYEQGVMNGQKWIIVKYVDVLKSGAIDENICSNLEHAKAATAARVAVLRSEDSGTTIAIDLKCIAFDFKRVNLGYASTIHKLQSGQGKIIVYKNTEDERYENCTHFYTAITRSTHTVIVLGTESVVSRTISRSAPIRRSQFAQLLQQALLQQQEGPEEPGTKRRKIDMTL